VLDILPHDVCNQFEKHVFAILAEASDVRNPSLGLYCLSIMKVFCDRSRRSSHVVDSGRSFSSTESEIWRSDAMQSFFSGVKAHKTLQLLVLRVIWACKPDRDGVTEEAFACVNLAKDVVTGVSRDFRVDWCQRNPAIVHKLHERTLQPDVSPELAFEVSRK